MCVGKVIICGNFHTRTDLVLCSNRWPPRQSMDVISFSFTTEIYTRSAHSVSLFLLLSSWWQRRQWYHQRTSHIIILLMMPWLLLPIILTGHIQLLQRIALTFIHTKWRKSEISTLNNKYMRIQFHVFSLNQRLAHTTLRRKRKKNTLAYNIILPLNLVKVTYRNQLGNFFRWQKKSGQEEKKKTVHCPAVGHREESSYKRFFYKLTIKMRQLNTRINNYDCWFSTMFSKFRPFIYKL